MAATKTFDPITVPVTAVEPGYVIKVDGRRGIVATIAKGRLITTIDLLTLGGHYSRTVYLPTEAVVAVSGTKAGF